MKDLNYLLKCVMIEHFNNTTQFLANTSVSVPAEVTKTIGYGVFTGSLVILASGIFNDLIRARLAAPSLKIKSGSGLNAKNLQRATALSVLALILPVALLFLFLAYIYKLLCYVIIKRKDKRFVSFLDSFDVFWSLEDDTVKSVINVLGVIKSDSPSSVVRNIKDKLQKILPNTDTEKLFFRRKEDCGFYYWRRNNVDINQYVQIVEFPDKPRPNTTDLENLMSKIANDSLPYNNEGLFKILITKQRVGNYDEERGEYGIIFRIHHSVGDGVALIEFLCNTLADNKDDCPLHSFSIPKMSKSMSLESSKKLMQMIQKLCELPICLADGILRKPDSNALHGPKLLNKQIFKWTESDEKLLKMVKDIKGSVDKMKFTDVLAAALSSGLHKFFSQTTLIPEDVAVVLPVRFPNITTVTSDLKLENDFSVTILDLPVKRQRIEAVQSRCDALRNSADPLTNYYLLKLLNRILPKQVLQPLLNSNQATVVFSNLPGPQRLSICGGVLKELIFFVPERGNTGIGVTALCYNGVLRFGAVADAALVTGPADLALILDGMVAEIRRLHQEHVK